MFNEKINDVDSSFTVHGRAARQSSKKTLIPLGWYCLWNNDMLLTGIETITQTPHTAVDKPRIEEMSWKQRGEKNQQQLHDWCQMQRLDESVYDESGVSI